MTATLNKIMTKNLVSVQVGTSLFEAHQIMKEKRIRHLPIIDLNDNLIGILSQRDLNYVPNSKNLTVEMMMASPVQVVEAEMPLRQAIFTMLEKKISSLLISSNQNEIIGIITTDDLLWHLAHLLNSDQKDLPLIDISHKQTLGQIAQELADAGI
jgi:CBS domain-containing protein